MDRMLTTAEAAALTPFKAATFRWWRHKNEGPPSVSIRGRVFYRRDELEAWLEEQMVGTERGGAA